MKTLKLAAIFLMLLVSGIWLRAQTVQLYPTATVNHGWAWCLNREVSGYVTYHLTYHLDKKTGKAVWCHMQVHKAELWDSETGEAFKMIDTGAKDSYGISWGWVNDLDNPGFDYDLPAGSIPFADKPSEGVNIWSTFKWIAPGGTKYTMRGMTVVHINANGETTVDFVKSYEDCND
jgi:hypothetical protein